MASMVGYQDVDPLVRRVKSSGMVNRLLQNICMAEGISKAGVKAELQSRLIESRSISSFPSGRSLLNYRIHLPCAPTSSFSH